MCLQLFNFLSILYRFKFPAVFVLYEMLPLGLFEISLLIGYTNRTKLFCKTQNIIESALQSSTFYCNLQGMYIQNINMVINSYSILCIAEIRRLFKISMYSGLHATIQ